MVAKSKPNPKSGFSLGWRGFAVFALSFVGLVSLVGFGFAHWTERQLLTTDNWVKLVEPIPKNDAVATSLSDYSVNRLFDKVNIDQKIADALPPKASFLAEPLSNQLEQRTKSRAKQAIQSDRFQGVWADANRIAHKKLVDKARGESEESPAKNKTIFNLNLSSLGATIREKLGSTSSPLFQNDQAAGANDSKIGIGVNLKTSFDKFRKFVNTVDFLNGVLGIFALACLLWAIAITKNRRRLVMILSASSGVIALLQIIGVKALRPFVLNQIETQSYRPAVGVVYDDLVATFEHGAVLLFIISLMIFLISFLVGYKTLVKDRHAVDFVKSVRSSGAYKELRKLRKQVGQYRYVLMGVAVLIILILLAVMSGYDWQGILRALFFAFILCAMIRLFAVLPNSSRRKLPM